METNGGNPNSNESQPSNASNTASKQKPTENDVFVNHGMSLFLKLKNLPPRRLGSVIKPTK